MRVFLFILLCGVASKFVFAEGPNEARRGAFPYMAFVYFPDERVIDTKGSRVTWSAVLIRPDWLISSSLEDDDTILEFPKKTLLARVGAISVDENYTFNEDEGEQEREVVTILRPYNYSRTEWWQDDISLLKTLLQFNMTTFVVTFTPNLPSKRDISEQSCFILLYAKRYQNATDRTLVQMAVELLPSTQENCGVKFRQETMSCGNNSDDKYKELIPSFCEGNSGGPLMCDNELTGIQTYIHDCQQPYLYQLLTTRENLLSCATEEKYDEISCTEICEVIKKDQPISPPALESLNTVMKKNVTESMVLDKVSSTDTTRTPISSIEEESSSTSESEPSNPTMAKETAVQVITNTSIISTTYSQDTTSVGSSENYTNTDEESFNPADERDRKANVEAHQQVERGVASYNSLSDFYSIMFLYLVLICLT